MANNLIFDLDELRERVDEVNPLDAQKTVKALIAKLKKYDSLYALCAPQIGIKERVIVFKYSGKTKKDNFYKEYINPRIFKAEEYHLVREKDISCPDKEFISPRPGKIFVEYQTQDARPETNVLKDNAAEVFDRMIHYLDGITLEDYGLEVLPEFDEADKDEQQAVIDLYLKSFKTRAEALDKEIEEDKDARELRDAIKFMEEVQEGKVKLESIPETELPKKEEEEVKEDA